MSDNTVRVESRFKNARLYNAIAERSLALSHAANGQAVQKEKPIKPWCDLVGIPYGSVYRLLNLQHGPVTRRGRLRDIAARLSVLLDAEPSWLFPSELYAHQWPTMVSHDVPMAVLESLSAATHVRAIGDPESAYALSNMGDVVRQAVQALPPRLGRVLTLRFGLDGHGERTLEEVGQHFGINKERVRQIEAKALRFIRHPARSKPLRSFLEGRT